jgi:hypothetical protein
VADEEERAAEEVSCVPARSTGLCGDCEHWADCMHGAATPMPAAGPAAVVTHTPG